MSVLESRVVWRWNSSSVFTTLVVITVMIYFNLIEWGINWNTDDLSFIVDETS